LSIIIICFLERGGSSKSLLLLRHLVQKCRFFVEEIQLEVVIEASLKDCLREPAKRLETAAAVETFKKEGAVETFG
jgi:hypothetical protein